MKQQDRKKTAAESPALTIDRRSALKKIAVGTGFLTGLALLPESWTRPVIQQIVLPAHAQSSGFTLHDPCTVTLLSGDNASAGVTVAVSGFVTPPIGNLATTITATAVGGGGASATVQTTTNSSGAFSAILAIGGGPGIATINVVTSVAGATGTAGCSVNTSAPQLTLNPCSLEINCGTTATASVNPGVTGSVSPATNDVPIQLEFTGFLAGGGTEIVPFNTTTGFGANPDGVYSVGPLFSSGPYTSFSVLVTSPGLGSTTCSIPVPATGTTC